MWKNCRATSTLCDYSVYTIETPAGLVMVDGGSKQTAPQAHRSIRKFTNQHLHTCIYTHAHVDHVWGPNEFKDNAGKRMQVIAHENVPKR